MSDRDQVAQNHLAAVLAFLSRARRVEAHSLAADPVALFKVSKGPIKVNFDLAQGTATMVQEFPPEEQVESAAARVRPLILNSDPTYYTKFFNGVGFFLRESAAPQEMVDDLRGMKTEWVAALPKGDALRGYEVRMSAAGADEERVSDTVLAFAWLYGDVVHADAEKLARTRSFGVEERFRAAVPLVARIMLLAMGALAFARHLHAHGWLPIGDEVFDLPVVVTDPTLRKEGRVYVAEARDGEDAVVVPPLGEELGPEWTPIHQAFGPAQDATGAATPGAAGS